MVLEFWTDRQKRLGAAEAFQFSHYLTGGQKQQLVPAEYPEVLDTNVRIGVPSRSRRNTSRQGNANQRLQNSSAIRVDGDNGSRPITPPPMLQVPPTSPPTHFPPMTPPPSSPPPIPGPSPPPAVTAAGNLPAHSYAGWPPPPIADGSGPMDEIRYQQQRQLAIQARHATALVPTPSGRQDGLAIDPSLLNPNLAQSPGLGPRHRHRLEVVMTPPRKRIAGGRGAGPRPPPPPPVSPGPSQQSPERQLRPRPRPIQKSHGQTAQGDALFLRNRRRGIPLSSENRG